MSGEIFGFSQLGSGSATGMQWVEDRDAVKQPTMHRTVPMTKNFLGKMSVVPRLRNSDLKWWWFDPGGSNGGFKKYLDLRYIWRQAESCTGFVDRLDVGF